MKTLDFPIVSVIIVVWNRVATIDNAIKSVLAQSRCDIECIVIDGGSTDGTLDVLRKYEGSIKYLSEPDRGIYDAMNKGISLAKGKWIYFLGSDDELIDSSVIAKVFSDGEADAELLYGDVKYRDGRIFASRFSDALIIKNSVHHQGAFYSASLFKNFSYNADFSVYSDYELNLIAYLNNFKAKRVAQIIALCGDGGVSDRPKLKNYVEEIKIRRKYLGLCRALPYDILTLIRWGGKTVIKCFQ